MQTIDTGNSVGIEANGLVSALFEACGAFAPGAEASPVCAACGWLEAEHTPVVAEVHSLPARKRATAAPKRLAS